MLHTRRLLLFKTHKTRLTRRMQAYTDGTSLRGEEPVLIQRMAGSALMLACIATRKLLPHGTVRAQTNHEKARQSSAVPALLHLTQDCYSMFGYGEIADRCHTRILCVRPQLAKVCRATGEGFTQQQDGILFFYLFSIFTAMLDKKTIHKRSSWLDNVRHIYSSDAPLESSAKADTPAEGCRCCHDAG